jgi:hypothetical protein
MLVHLFRPPLFDISPNIPSSWIGIMKSKPTFQTRPHTDGEPTFENQMGGEFLNLIAKLARSTILSSSLFKPIHHPNSIFA